MELPWNRSLKPSRAAYQGSSPVYAIVPKASREVHAQATKWGLDRMLENGITALVDASTSEPDALAYADLADQGILKQRVRGCMWAAAQPGPYELRPDERHKKGQGTGRNT